MVVLSQRLLRITPYRGGGRLSMRVGRLSQVKDVEKTEDRVSRKTALYYR